MRRPVVIFFLLTLVAAACPASSSTRVPPDEAKALVRSGARLVDVRTPEEFAAGHLEGAINVPVDDLEARQGELGREAALVLYCRSGARSARAQAMLKKAGFEKVYDLGGMSNWK